jgi:Mn2+/Fe2+ NRAMP family transporter
MEQQTKLLGGALGPCLGSKLRNRVVVRIAVGVLLAISALRLNAPHIEPSYDAATLAHVFGSICIAVLSLFLIASGVRALEATGVTSAGDQKKSEPEGKAL